MDRKPDATSPRLRLYCLRVLIFGGNFSYELNNVWYSGWMPNLLQRSLKFWREGWGRSHGNGQHVYTWREFCWRFPHDHR